MHTLATAYIVLTVMFLLSLAYRGKGGGWRDWGFISKRPGEEGWNPNHWLLRTLRTLRLPEQWGYSSVASHGLSALVGGSLVMFILTHSWIAAILAAPAFFLLTKPDIGTGFALYHDDDARFLADITQERNDPWIWKWVFDLADGGALRILRYTGWQRVAACYWMFVRMAGLGLPLAILAHAFGAHHHPLGFALLFGFGACYIEGLILMKKPFYRDPVEAAELAFGPYAAPALVLLALPLA